MPPNKWYDFGRVSARKDLVPVASSCYAKLTVKWSLKNKTWDRLPYVGFEVVDELGDNERLTHVDVDAGTGACHFML